MHELPDEYLADALPIAKKIAVAQGVENYNILQVSPVAPIHHPSAGGGGFTTTPGLTIHCICDRIMDASRIRCG